MRIHNILLFLSFLFIFHTSSGQEGALQLYQNGFYVRQYSEMAGLVNNGCKNVFEDSKGFLWITTFNGLSRFDGKHFTNYGVKDGLPGSNITQVSEDSLGYIYVATPTGIARYTGFNPNTNSYFHVYPHTKDLDIPIAEMEAIDSNTILFQQRNGSLFLLKGNKTKLLYPGSTGAGGRILRGKNDYYYVDINDSVQVFDRHFINVGNIPRPASVSAAESVDSAGGLHLYAGNGEKYRVVNTKIVAKSTVPDSIVWFASMDTSDKMMYAKNDEIFFYDGKASSAILDLTTFRVNANSVTKARDGTVWVCSGGAGLFRITKLPYRDVNLSAGGYFFYFRNNTRFINTGTELSTVPNLAEAYHQLKKITVSIVRDKNNITWFCTDKGIYKKAPGRPLENYLFPGNSGFWGVSANRIFTAFEAANGDIWFNGSSGAILYRNGTFKHYNSRNGLKKDGERISQLRVDKDHNVLLIDTYSRLLCIQGDTIVPVIDQVTMHPIIADRMQIDSDGFIWIEYNSKLSKIERQKNGNYRAVDSITSSPLFPLSEIKVFKFDPLDNCWVGYAGGKIKVYLKTPDGHYTEDNTICYTADDGLAPIAATYYEVHPDDNNNMVVITPRLDGKIFVLSLADVVKRKMMQTFIVSITQILVNHKVPDWTSRGYVAGPEGVPVSCKLNYADNDIAFSYTGIYLNNASDIVYQTMLEGYDDEWQTSTTTTANYTNLSPGKYKFLVKAANISGGWSVPYAYSFTILPPWYKTWWAMLLWIGVGSSIILFFFFLRLNYIRMSNLRESNTFKSSLIGLIGHDMMTPLHYIAKVSSQLKMYNGKLSQKTTLESLGDITVTASRLRFFGESILHWINLQNTEFSPAKEKFRLNETIKDLVEFHQLLAAEKDNTISYDIHEDLFCYQDPTLIKIILHNLLLNANKFTVNGKIRILATIEANWLTVKVIDTGKGMDPTKVDRLNQFLPVISSLGTSKEKGWGMGYKMIIDLLKFSNGTLHVKSKLNEGTEVTIKLFSGRKEYAHKFWTLNHN